MLPVLQLGEPLSDAPEIEFMRDEIHPIAACVVDLNFDMSDELIGCLFGLTVGDCLFLDNESEPVFWMIEDVCKKITAGEVTRYSMVRLQASRAVGHIILDFGDQGHLGPEVVAAAQGFLDFLKANPAYWPPRFDANRK